ncbi:MULTISPECIES: hypothetical protein [Rhodococcus]|uniref:hypothetical protein n=1 Tax=Rhodococcus TaxID=1827 RepID=UPI001D193398|nr:MULTISPECIES: hypothetical protein [Rhodococcus]MCC4306835.1 hypothetical protein [Rhodococcus sp. 3-2]
MNDDSAANEVDGSSRENAAGQRTRLRWWSDESLASRVLGGDRTMKRIGRAVDAGVKLIGFVVVVIRIVAGLKYGFPDLSTVPAEFGLVQSVGPVLRFEGVRRVLIVALALPLILVGWLVRWVRGA